MKCNDPASRVIAAVLTGVLLLMLLCGCGGSGRDRDALIVDGTTKPADGACTMTFFGFKADAINLTAIEDALKGYMDEHQNVVVSYEGFKGSGYYDILEKRNKTDHLDDIFMVDHDHLVALAQEGKLADLRALPGLEDYTDAAREQFTDPDGAVFFLPTCISTYNLYINYDLMEAHGQKLPTNYAELSAVCDHFVSQGIVPIVANNFASLSTLITARGLNEVYNGPDAAEKIAAFNTAPNDLADALTPGLELVADMVARGWLDPAEVSVTNQTSDDLDLFAKGDRPFMVTGGWATVRLPSRGVDFAYGVHPYPVLDNGSILSMQVDTCIAVNAASQNLEQAMDFVSYLIRPEVMWNYCDSQASYTPLREEKRIPSEATLVPSSSYLVSGPIAVRSDYRVTIPLYTAVADSAEVLLEGGTVAAAKAALLQGLKT